MKFSILALLVATAYAALVFAALREPDSWWRYASIVAWLAILAYVFMLATDVHNRGKAVFGRMFVACLAAYLVLTWLPASIAPANRKPDLLPHHWLAAWLTKQPPVALTPPASAYGPQPVQGNSNPFVGAIPAGASYRVPLDNWPRIIEAVAALNVALLFGLLAGILALWRYRRNERAASGS